MDAVLGEAAFTVTDDKVSITEMHVSAISGLTLSLHPSPGNSHTIVAKATGIQTLSAPKQVSVSTISMVSAGGCGEMKATLGPEGNRLVPAQAAS